ncbi:baseplate J/gp47 family protein [Thiohalophilus sp.]|uniref:baseplate J/gp47 family protein n=1 Tax=Thiohalophilus sp. TaxID=3028392 RepID=UPI002ACE1FAC|nr:baseplate J/gp47 family protein [Thiohalophilus sp.]MDZ7804346.1 baseplate J/gp47 family protein [Thiohalophilus sp.]
MPFNRPTLQTLIDRLQTDIESRLPGTDARLRRSALNVLARVQSGLAHGLYGNLDWLAKQVVPDTAEAEILERFATWWGITRKSATPAVGNIAITGTDGSVIPAGTLWQRSDGAEFSTDEEVTIASGTATAAVTASEAGADGNTTAGSTLSIVSPIAGVDSSATVDGDGLSNGTDQETDDQLRDRLRQRVQEPPEGGAISDYKAWSREVEGVTRVWVMPQWDGAGTVGVYVVRDDDDDFIPDAAEITAVQDYIDARRPVTADVTVYAPTPVAVDMTIQLSPNTSTVQSAVEAQLQDLFLRADVEDGNGSGTILLSHIREAISQAAGELDHVLVTPDADVTFSAGEIGTLDTITWQAIA